MKKMTHCMALMIIYMMIVATCAFSAMAAESAAPPKLTIDPSNTAFMLLHWQNDLVALNGKFAGDLPKLIAEAKNIENTAAALKASREKGMLVIYVALSYRPGYPEFPQAIGGIAGHVKEAQAFLRGSWGAEPIDQLKPLEEEPVVFNSSSDAFCYTDLELILRNRGIKNLVLTGMCTNFVVESTAREALNRCFSVTVLEDCCNSFARELHNWSIKNIMPSFAMISNSETYTKILSNNQ